MTQVFGKHVSKVDFNIAGDSHAAFVVAAAAAVGLIGPANLVKGVSWLLIRRRLSGRPNSLRRFTFPDNQRRSGSGKTHRKRKRQFHSTGGKVGRGTVGLSGVRVGTRYIQGADGFGDRPLRRFCG